MASDAVLADSCVFISLLREGRDVFRWWRERFGDLFTCGMIRVEVVRGIRSPAIRRDIERLLDTACNVPADGRVWQSAADLGWELARSGLMIPAADLVIAACALRAKVPVLTADRHFARVPGLRVEWFDPAV